MRTHFFLNLVTTPFHQSYSGLESFFTPHILTYLKFDSYPIFLFQISCFIFYFILIYFFVLITLLWFSLHLLSCSCSSLLYGWRSSISSANQMRFNFSSPLILSALILNCPCTLWSRWIADRGSRVVWGVRTEFPRSLVRIQPGAWIFVDFLQSFQSYNRDGPKSSILLKMPHRKYSLPSLYVLNNVVDI